MQLNQEILSRFGQWYDDAKANDPIFHCGFALASVDDNGQPSNRIVLLKEYDENGFVFFTNYLSRKGLELIKNPKVAATFWWSAFQRQIRIEGTIEKVSAEESAEYFHSRPHLSQVAGYISEQSRPIGSFAELENRFAQAQSQFPDKVPCPEHWGGYRIIPHAIEFWQGMDHRLHERHLFTIGDEDWGRQILQP